MSTATLEEVEVETGVKETLTCRNRVLGKSITANCEICQSDYNQDHHPNNFDCRRHTPMRVWYFDVVESYYE